MSQYSPPGYVQDLPAAGLQQWSKIVEKFFHDVRAAKFFFSPLDLPAGQTGTTKLIPWNAFPKKYQSTGNPDPEYCYKATENPVTKDMDNRNYSEIYSSKGGSQAEFEANGIQTFLFRDQDEYLEWKTFKRADGTIEKIVFTCDHPEYWKFIADYDINLLVQLYQKYVSPSVVKNDLLFQQDVFEINEQQQIVNIKGKYNPFNKWNTTDGIMHLTHPANYLSAEIQLGADATKLRKDQNGTVITDADKLIRCARYGSPRRFSDPKIGSDINTLVRNGLSVSIQDPVALYIHDVMEANYTFPAGLTLQDFWKVTRGDVGRKMVLRAEFAAPSGSGIMLEQIKVNNKPLKYGGQIADTINMGIYGLGYHFPASGNPVPEPCVGAGVPHMAMEAMALSHPIGMQKKKFVR